MQDQALEKTSEKQLDHCKSAYVRKSEQVQTMGQYKLLFYPQKWLGLQSI